jgi:hypothetical protein
MTKESLHIIVGPEVGAEFPGDTRYYKKFCQMPTYPGGESGVTIGIGYDLGYNNKQQIKLDWSGRVSGNHLAFFMNCSGIKGSMCKQLINASTRVLSVPYEIAMDVFTQVTLPKFTAKTKAIYPNLENLNETTQAVLIGLVYNRGNSLEGDRRVEMRELVEYTNNADYEAIAATIDKMKRLWVGTDTKGLVTRREEEAKLILQSV